MYANAVQSRKFERMGLKAAANVKGFVKVERSAQPYVALDGSETGRKAPRPIHTRDVAFHIEFGRRTLPIEHVLYDIVALMCVPGALIGDDVLPVIAKGMTPDEKAALLRSHWDNAGGDDVACAISLDQSGFDAHIGEMDLDYEASVMQFFFPTDKLLPRLFAELKVNRVTSWFKDGRVKTKLGPMRMSGDMNTSLGNCLISATLAWLLTRDFADTTFVVDGDDTILFTPKRHLKSLLGRVEEHYLSYGFDAVCEEPAMWFEAIEFCQCHPVYDGSVWRMVRNWTKCLTNDYSTFGKGDSPESFRKHMHAVASCGMALHYGIPILQEHYLYGLRHGIKSNIDWAGERRSYIFEQAKKMGGFRRQQPVSDSARVSFWLAFGITPDVQEAIEESYRLATYDDRLVNLRGLPANEFTNSKSATITLPYHLGHHH